MDKWGRDIRAVKWLSVSFFPNMEVVCFKPWGIVKRESVTECNPRNHKSCDRRERSNNCGDRFNQMPAAADRHANVPCNR
jgi:hypothetical protein